MTEKIIIIGAGLGGLATAVRLSYHGYDVEMIEKNTVPGGKLQFREQEGYHFDLGPSTLTMIEVFENLFQSCNRNIHDYLTFYPIKDGTSNYFPDNSIVQFNQDMKQVQEDIARYSQKDADNYPAFLAASKKFYDIAQRNFLNRLFLTTKDKMSPILMMNLLKVKPFTHYHDWLKQYFSHPNTLQLFGRYATYVGSSPYSAPAIYGMMSHIEAGLGVYGIKGGTYQLVRALETLALELGVKIHYQEEVESIATEYQKVVGVKVNGKLRKVDQVIGNVDMLTVYTKLLKNHRMDKKIAKLEPSLSGFALLLGVKKRYDQLKHHQVFFEEAYENEFESIFGTNTLPANPTIYICNASYSDASLIPNENASNLFVLVNAPHLSDMYDWENYKEIYAKKILERLEQLGLTKLRENIEYMEIMTPEDLKKTTGAHLGTTYGPSSNSFSQAFFRIPNRDKVFKNLWFVGGSVHPGGGTPIVTLSGGLVADEIIRKSKKG
ncbi:phytoene desaturase family protein [Saliterribacillus persicus]|uniref:phytoene desaturase family protein n=1 Tax=Saliterribacillus persicus TaxID=930114 RepID=UPI001FE541AD|nr:phytoene desaturase family protein [Saliterribacillus persicus]